MADHRYILSAGHRNTNRGGAVGESDWTYGATVALKNAIIARGGQAWIVQEEDGDGDPDDYRNGGLQAAASKCVSLADKFGPFLAYISMHYNGTGSRNGSGFHGVYPDSPTGGIDVAGNNSLDIRAISNIAERVRKMNTVGLYGGSGKMSERSTRVGGQGFRLGEFVGTYGFRQTTARIILEAANISNPDEAKHIKSDAWVKRYAEAIVDGLEDTFGKMGQDSTGGGGQPDPEPKPEPPPIEYAKPRPIEALEDSPAYHEVKDSKGKVIAQLIRVDYDVKAVRDTPRLQYAENGSAKVGPDVKAGSVFGVTYLILNADGTKFWYSAYATRFVFEDAVPYFADSTDDPNVVDG